MTEERSEADIAFEELLQTEVAVTVPITINTFMNLRAFLLVDRNRKLQDRHILYDFTERVYEIAKKEAVLIIKEHNAKYGNGKQGCQNF